MSEIDDREAAQRAAAAVHLREQADLLAEHTPKLAEKVERLREQLVGAEDALAEHRVEVDRAQAEAEEAEDLAAGDELADGAHTTALAETATAEGAI